MKQLPVIFIACLVFEGCRSSYDESRQRPEVNSAAASPKVESAVSLQPVPQPALPVEDPATIAVAHDATEAELKKYNCKGSARITDSGMDDNKDGILQDEEIQETRIDCTEVVPGTASKP